MGGFTGAKWNWRPAIVTRITFKSCRIRKKPLLKMWQADQFPTRTSSAKNLLFLELGSGFWAWASPVPCLGLPWAFPTPSLATPCAQSPSGAHPVPSQSLPGQHELDEKNLQITQQGQSEREGLEDHMPCLHNWLTGPILEAGAQTRPSEDP